MYNLYQDFLLGWWSGSGVCLSKREALSSHPSAAKKKKKGFPSIPADF
jgi:hypothetical protein